MKNFHRKYIFYLLFMVFLFGFFRFSPLTGWDESFYWGQLTSVWYDGDLTLHNDLLANRNGIEVQRNTITLTKQDGSLYNNFSLGTAVIDGIYTGPVLYIHRLLNLPRMSSLFLSIVAIGAIFKILAVLLALERLLKKYSQENRSVVYFAVTSVFFGTPLLVYSLNWYSMAHLNSSLLATVFVLLAITWLDSPRTLQSLALGIVAGMMILVRWQNGIYVLFILPPLLYKILSDSQTTLRLRSGQGCLRYVKGSAIVVVCVLLITSLQCIAWYKQFGAALLIPQGAAFMKWDSPQWIPLLFSGYHGLIPWSPVVVLAWIGIILAIVRNRGVWRWLMLGALLTVIAMTYVNACVEDWFAGSSYGARRFCNLVPLFALGVFALLKSLNKKIVLLLFLLILLWTHFTYTCYFSRIDDLAVPILGRRSHTSPMNDPYWITDGEQARSILFKELPSPFYKGLQLFGFKNRKYLDRIISVMTLLGALLLANTLFVVWRTRKGFKKTVLFGVVGYIIMFSLMTTFLFPNSYRLNGPWRRYLERQLTPDEAIEAGLPVEAVRFIQAMTLVSQERTQEAENVLESVNTNHYPNLRTDKIAELFE